MIRFWKTIKKSGKNLKIFLCYHFSLNKSRQRLEKRFQAKFVAPDSFTPVFYVNGFNFPEMPVITNRMNQTIQFFHWGLIPYWIKDKDSAEQIKSKILNARADTVFEKASYRRANQKQRCLVLADGFFDWRLYQEKKYPYIIFI